MLSETKSRFAGKNLLLILILHSTFLIVNCFSQQYGWIDISGNLPKFPGDTIIYGTDTLHAGLRSPQFINDDEGWISTAITDSGVILHTANGGYTWDVQNIQDYIVAIEMFDAMEGYAAAREGTIYHTNDGGETWEFHAPTFAVLSDMDFPPGSETGYACGMWSAIFRITPQGVEQMNTGISDFVAIHFVDRNHGWACGESVLKEYVNGTWTGGHSYLDGSWSDVFFIDSLNGWGAGFWISGSPSDTVGIIHTSNDSSWFPSLLNVGYAGDFTQVFFIDNQMGWTINNGGGIYSTTDGGESWNLEAQGMTDEGLSGIQFTSLTNGYVVGNNKTLLKYTQLTPVEEESTQPTEFKLEQNYPNPFNPSTKIRFTISDLRFTTLKVFDVLGREVATLVDEYKPTGSYEIAFNVAQESVPAIASGVYFYQLKAENFIETKKMILLR